MQMENDCFRVVVDPHHGAVTSLLLKGIKAELIGEPALASNFRIGLPQPAYLANYLDGMAQTPAVVELDRAAQSARVCFTGMHNERGFFDLDLEYTITLRADRVAFASRLTNRQPEPVAEFWFPRLGGLVDLAGRRDAQMTYPAYTSAAQFNLYQRFPGLQGLGSEHAEYSVCYPTGAMVMPWMDQYDPGSDTGLYLGYHDPLCRMSMWHWYLHPTATGRANDQWMTAEEAQGQPRGLTFSHVRFPHIRDGETLDTGEFVIHAHPGDWHTGARQYRQWFDQHFPLDPQPNWLRRRRTWFTSIIYQGEDRLVADYPTYDQWCTDAQDVGINTFELIGWDRGGIERDYPFYYPEEKLGGWDAYRKLCQAIDARGGKLLTFTNYQCLDSCTKEYHEKLHLWRHMDSFGNTPFWGGWGESTLIARRNLDTRRHVVASIVPELEEMLAGFFEDIVRAGSHGMQVDKLVFGHMLDFNPRCTMKPDLAMHEALIQAFARLLPRLHRINPDFALAVECLHDRMIPYASVFYRNVSGPHISPLKYLFPEWTACQHIYAPRDFVGVNQAVLTEAVITVEPFAYQGSLRDPLWRELARYIQEVERIRGELEDVLFLGRFLDQEGAQVQPVGAIAPKVEPAAERRITPGDMAGMSAPAARKDSGKLQFSTHVSHAGRRAIVVVNPTREPIAYRWRFDPRPAALVDCHEPFQPVRRESCDQPLTIPGEGLHVLVEPAQPTAG